MTDDPYVAVQFENQIGVTAFLYSTSADQFDFDFDYGGVANHP